MSASESHAPTTRAATGARAPMKRGIVAAVTFALAATATVAAAQTASSQWPPGDLGDVGHKQATQGVEPGPLTVYASRDDLFTAAGDIALVVEDFSAGFTRSNDVHVCHQSVGSHSDDPCFRPGDLASGFGMRSSRGNIFSDAGDSDLVVLGPGILGTPTKVIGANQPDPPSNPTHIRFEPRVTFVGMQVYDGMQGGPVQIEAYGEDDTLIGSFEVSPPALNAPVFAGFSSPVPVRRIHLNATANGGAELIGELVFGGGDGRLAANPAQLDFGAVAVGDTAEATLTLTNEGHLDIAAPVADEPAAPYAIALDGCAGAVLARGESCQIDYAFAPGYEGRFDAQASFGEEGPVVPIQGDGAGAWIAASPGHASFATTEGSASAPQTVTLTNLTGVSVEIVALGEADGFEHVGGDCGQAPFDLAPGAHCALDFRFAPARAGRFDAAVAVHGSGGELASITLSGQAAAAAGRR